MSRRSTYILYRPSTRQSAVMGVHRAPPCSAPAWRLPPRRGPLSARSCAVVTRSSLAKVHGGAGGHLRATTRRLAAPGHRDRFDADCRAGSQPRASGARTGTGARARLPVRCAPAYTAACRRRRLAPLADAIPAAIPRAALVTGGAKRLGRAICLGAGGSGLRRRAALRGAAPPRRRTRRRRSAPLGRRAVALRADLAREAEVAALLPAAAAALGAAGRRAGEQRQRLRARRVGRTPRARAGTGTWSRTSAPPSC